MAVKILKTIPDHVFWDIKRPLHDAEKDHLTNPHNPARAVAGADFFDIRANYSYFKEREVKSNIATSVSRFNYYWAPFSILNRKDY